MSISQKKVAEKAGVSFITISRVVNNKNNVKPETKQKVLKAIKEMGYSPNALARGLNQNCTNSIGLSFAGYISDSPFFSQMMKGIENVCMKNGFNILLYTSKGKNGIINYEESFKERLVDGLLVMAPDMKNNKIQTFIKSKIPFVIINGRYKGADYVDTDNMQGAKESVEYLIMLGHKRIGFINGWQNVINCHHRLAGYKSVLKNNNIKTDERLVFQGDFSINAGKKAVQYFLSLTNPPTAIFAANDLMAFGAIQSLKKHKLNIPDDISVIGFDDIDLASLFMPALTTVKQPIEQIGVEAAKILIEKIKGKQKNIVNKILPAHLVIRSSCKVI